MAVDQLTQDFLRFGLAALSFEGIDDGRFKHVARRIDDGELAAIGKTRVKSEHNVPAHRRLQQQIAQIALEKHRRLILRPFCARFAHFFFEGRL